MDYEQKYKEALSRARVVNPGTKDYSIVTTIFPELKKSDDERIRENAIQIIRYSMDGTDVALPLSIYKECIAWLEKQGEQRSDSKVEPKFKVGDWVVEINFPRCHYRVIAVYESWYEAIDADDFHYSIDFKCEAKFRPWTIQDAKDGDVLVCEGKISKDKYGQEVGIVKKYVGRIGGCDNCFKTYCFIDWDGNFIVDKDMGSSNIHPATKEQCNLLFQKIEEAGYEWDSNKKELIK